MNEQIPSIAVVHQAHELFAQLKEKGYRKENLGLLKGMREKMLMNGFDAPFKALLARTYSEAEIERDEEIADLKKQMNYLKQMALLKKGALKRVNIAIGAHFLAHSFMRMGYADVLDHLAFDGNYIDFLFKSGVNGVKTYRKLMDSFEEKGEVLPVYTAEILFKGSAYKVKIKNRGELEDRIRREFGPEARVMDVKTSKKEYPMIKSKSIRTCLISAVVSYVSRQENDIKELRKKAIGLLFSPIFKFYLINSSQERKKNNLYYSLTNSPSSEQMKLFDLLREMDPELKNASAVIREKLELEKKMTVQSRLIGAGVLAKHVKKDREWVAKYLGMEAADVEKGIEYVNAYSGKGRGAEFLEHLKK